MSLQKLPSIDPVCLTKLDASVESHQLIHRDITYHFCSAHCLERFSEAPTFFTAPRRLDDQHPIPKHHRLHFSSTSQSTSEMAAAHLREIRGVSSVRVAKNYADIDYDLRLVCLRQLEDAMGSAGLLLKGGFYSLTRSMWGFLEHNELENLATQPSPCCSRPPIRIR